MVSPAPSTQNLETLRSTVETFHQEAQRDLWRAGHGPSPSRPDVEAVLVVGLMAFYGIRDLDARWSAVVRSGLVAFDPAAARQIESLYNTWYAPAIAIMQMIDSFEAQGEKLENAQAFRTAVADCPRLDVDKTLRALESERAGRGVSRQEALNELRRRILPRSN